MRKSVISRKFMITYHHYLKEKSLSSLPHTSNRLSVIKLLTKNVNQMSLHWNFYGQCSGSQIYASNNKKPVESVNCLNLKYTTSSGAIWHDLVYVWECVCVVCQITENLRTSYIVDKRFWTSNVNHLGTVCWFGTLRKIMTCIDNKINLNPPIDINYIDLLYRFVICFLLCDEYRKSNFILFIVWHNFFNDRTYL